MLLRGWYGKREEHDWVDDPDGPGVYKDGEKVANSKRKVTHTIELPWQSVQVVADMFEFMMADSTMRGINRHTLGFEQFRAHTLEVFGFSEQSIPLGWELWTLEECRTRFMAYLPGVNFNIAAEAEDWATRAERRKNGVSDKDIEVLLPQVKLYELFPALKGRLEREEEAARDLVLPFGPAPPESPSMALREVEGGAEEDDRSEAESRSRDP